MKNKSCGKAPAKSEKVMETLWLRYYNSVLLEKGLISEELFRKIEREILNRPSDRKQGR